MSCPFLPVSGWHTEKFTYVLRILSKKGKRRELKSVYSVIYFCWPSHQACDIQKCETKALAATIVQEGEDLGGFCSQDLFVHPDLSLCDGGRIVLLIGKVPSTNVCNTWGLTLAVVQRWNGVRVGSVYTGEPHGFSSKSLVIFQTQGQIRS